MVIKTSSTSTVPKKKQVSHKLLISDGGGIGCTWGWKLRRRRRHLDILVQVEQKGEWCRWWWTHTRDISVGGSWLSRRRRLYIGLWLSFFGSRWNGWLLNGFLWSTGVNCDGFIFRIGEYMVDWIFWEISEDADKSWTIDPYILEHELIKRPIFQYKTRIGTHGKDIPRSSFCRSQSLPSGQSFRLMIFGSRNPFFRSLAHHSFNPQRKISPAHNRQAFVLGELISTSGPGATEWISVNKSDSMRGANPRGCFCIWLMT